MIDPTAESARAQAPGFFRRLVAAALKATDGGK